RYHLLSNVLWSLKKASYADLFEPQIDHTRRDSYGRYMALEPLPNADYLKQTYTADFFSPMMSSQNQQACRMRFFFFINGEPATISATHLDIYIRLASKMTIEPQPITRLRLNIQGDLQQRWNMAVANYQSTKPFQFVFRGVIGTNQSRI